LNQLKCVFQRRGQCGARLLAESPNGEGRVIVERPVPRLVIASGSLRMVSQYAGKYDGEPQQDKDDR
jgi:hypothetical protein